MKKNSLMMWLALVMPLFALAQSPHAPNYEREPVKANYQLASRFSPQKLRKMIFSTEVRPNWLRQGDQFWYVYETSEGKKWYLVDPAERKKEPLFDNADFAAQLTRIVKDPFDAQNIDIRGILFNDDGRSFRFEVNSTKDTVKTEKERKNSRNRADSLKKKVFYLEYDLRTRQIVELSDTLKP